MRCLLLVKRGSGLRDELGGSIYLTGLVAIALDFFSPCRQRITMPNKAINKPIDNRLTRPFSPPIKASVTPKIKIKPETGSLRYTDEANASPVLPWRGTVRLKNLANKGFTFCLRK